MKTNKEVLKIAQKHLGQGGARFRKFCGLPSGAAWCNAFVDYVANEGGVAQLYFNSRKETYCPHSIQWCKSNLAQIPLYLAMPMDIIYFDWEKNGVPNHIGLVRAHKSTVDIYTIEGNTSGGIVAQKTRNGKYVQAVFRPHYKHAITLGTLKIDGSFGYNSIANLQRALGGCTIDGVLGKATVKRLQHYLAITEDGNWGRATSKAVQKLVGVPADGEFGPQSVKALQRWINKQNGKPIPEPEPEPTPTPDPEPAKPTRAEKIIAKVDELAYRYGTPKKDYSYKKGNPKYTYKLALKKYLGKSARISQSDCGYFVSTVIRAAGVSKKFLALKGRKEPFPSLPSGLKYVHKGKEIPKGLLKPGDIIRYKKKGGGQHTLMYYGNGKIAEAGRGHWFPAIKKNTKKYNKSNVKKSTIQVIRAKE